MQSKGGEFANLLTGLMETSSDGAYTYSACCFVLVSSKKK